MGMNLKGWDSLERLLRERKYTESEIDEARRSFQRGLEILYRLYISFRKRENDQSSAGMRDYKKQNEKQNILSKLV